jgi:hypothetical protein
MKHINSADDMNGMLAAENAALFVWVNWSTYAQHGSEIFRTAKSRLAGQQLGNTISWYVADLSSPGVTPVASSLHSWLESQHNDGDIRLFPNIDMGNGSTIMLRNGKVVGFEPSALQSGVEGLARSMKEAFSSIRKLES